MFDVDPVIVRHHHAMLDRSAEFTDISRPRIGNEQMQCLIRQRFERSLVFFGEFFEEGVREENNVFGSLAQGGHLDLNNV